MNLLQWVAALILGIASFSVILIVWLLDEDVRAPEEELRGEKAGVSSRRAA